MRLGAHDEARLPGLETVVTELCAELDEFLDLEESCWRNIGVPGEPVLLFGRKLNTQRTKEHPRVFVARKESTRV